jgi:4-hydroxy-tetrahydrodipicolinate synthase/2-keto-3-deoxy-L-arabinonate dehydratase
MPRPYRGVFPILPTTFDDAGDLDGVSQLRAVDFFLEAGVDGFGILANYSEQFALSDVEREHLTRSILRHAPGRVPVIVTTSHFSSRVAAERSRQAQDLGAAMVMLMPPYHGATIRADENGIFEFFASVAGAITIPIMIQDSPVSGTNLSPSFLVRLAAEIPNVRYFKIEVPGTTAKLRELIRRGGAAIEGPFDGEEGITLIHDLAAGATGTMPGGMIPELFQEILTLFQAGRTEEARERYDRILPLINYENKVGGFRATKALLAEGGIIRSEAARAPTPARLSPESRQGLIDLARRLDPLALRYRG